MAPPSSTRRHPWSSDAGGELSLPRKRWQSVVLQVKGKRRASLEGMFGFRQIRGQEFMRMLLPVLGSMVQRVVSEEIEKTFRQFTTPSPPRLLVGRNQRPRYQLVFLNGLKTVYTMSKLESDEGTAVKVAIIETLTNNQTEIVSSGHLSSVKVEVVVLHGHFNGKNEESWAPEDFNHHIVSGREKSGQLLTGNLILKLNEGEAFLENATFTDNSSFTSTKMFRLGLRLLNASGDRVLEGVTEPFRVSEGAQGFEKHYPPTLDDEVWRLEKIRKNGPYHQALSNEGIDSVQKFLRAYMMDEQKLIKIFSKMAHSTWKSIIGHAMTCKFGDGLYLHKVKDQDAGLFFDAIYKLVGVKFGDCYKPLDQLDQMEKNLADSLKRAAYQNMGNLQYNYKMVNNQPVLQRFPAHQGTSMFPVPNKQIPHAQHNPYLGDTSNAASRHSRENFATSSGTSNAGVGITRFVQGQTSHDVYSRHEPITDIVVHYSSSHGALLPGPRVTQLQIPQTEATYFGPDGSCTAVPCNCLCHSRNTLSSTNDVMSLTQSQFPLPQNSESYHLPQQCNDQSVIQSQQAVTGYQPSRTNSFDVSCDELIQSFMSQISNSEGVSTPFSPRKWVKIRAALKLASVGRLSRGSRRGPYCAPPRPRLVPTI
ncbi:hypothetical protein PR202_gb23536 [Eleusine coracana subsp. coracana]|uniref:Calmodulin-binding protein n=1 Tax=Eleusine coracana subsp. coracana TaxID=191504 RepID=A0AAV5FJ86_ELECO|nr:hypothetical protein PR202_gb23536 [Eleusine coracana subsp. coracana]